MKSISLFVMFVYTLIVNSQSKIEADLLTSVDSVQSATVRIISCGTSIMNNNPLFIIDGIPILREKNDYLSDLEPNQVKSINVIKGAEAITLYGSSALNGVVLISTKTNDIQVLKKRNKYPFKVYQIRNKNWTRIQDIYNAIEANVPGIQINSNNSNSDGPKISMRGNEDIIVIVDGIRYDSSILKTINPADIESIKISNNPAAQNYFINY